MTETDKVLMDIKQSCGRIEQKLDSHIENLVIHQTPPCSFYKSLVTRIWAIFVVGLLALGTSIWAVIIGGKH